MRYEPLSPVPRVMNFELKIMNFQPSIPGAKCLQILCMFVTLKPYYVYNPYSYSLLASLGNVSTAARSYY